MMKVKAARDAAPKTAPMETNADAPAERCAPGKILSTPSAKTPPIAALDINIGASSPPDVPEPSETTSATAFANITTTRNFRARFAFKMSLIVSYPTPKTRGTKYPIIPNPNAPIAGHQSSSIGNFLKLVFCPIEQLAKTNRSQPTDTSEQHIERKRVRNAKIHSGYREHRASPQELHVDSGCDGACNDK